MTKLNYVRHGDAPFQKLDNSFLEKLSGMKSRKIEKLVTNLGEVHGHSHDVVPVEGTEIIEFSNNENGSTPDDEKIYFQLKGGPGVIFHEEHGPITLDEGVYVRTEKRDYNPFSNVVERVRD